MSRNAIDLPFCLTSAHVPGAALLANLSIISHFVAGELPPRRWSTESQFPPPCFCCSRNGPNRS